MSICFHSLGKYQRAIESARESASLNPTTKAFYRQAVSHKAKKEYSLAICGIKEAIKISRALVHEKDCHQMLGELANLEKLEKHKEQQRLKKL